MLAHRSPQITRRRRRSALPVLLALAVPLAFAACDSADKTFAPPSEPASEPAAEPAAADYVLAAATGQRIVFASYRNGNQPDIYKMDPQGNSLAPVSLGSGDEDAVPAWSYDNQRVVMQRRRPYGTGYTTDIYVKNADGSNGHWVRPTAFPFLLRDPSWSPDGSRILLTVELNGGAYLAWMSVATGEVTLLNAAGGGVPGRYPSYNATGQRIVYVASFGKSIDQVNADGTGHKVLVAPGNYVRDPVYSPDGKKIAFDRVAGTGYNQEIWVKNLVDGTTKRLTFTSGTDTQPTWSPDGTRIAFASQRSGQYQIWTMTASGGSQTRITHTSVAELAPAWSH